MWWIRKTGRPRSHGIHQSLTPPLFRSREITSEVFDMKSVVAPSSADESMLVSLEDPELSWRYCIVCCHRLYPHKLQLGFD